MEIKPSEALKGASDDKYDAKVTKMMRNYKDNNNVTNTMTT